MYTTAVIEALADMIVVIGMHPDGYVPTRVLFDPSCTHSFLLYTHIDRIGVK